jgi:hypothetical protein
MARVLSLKAKRRCEYGRSESRHHIGISPNDERPVALPGDLNAPTTPVTSFACRVPAPCDGRVIGGSVFALQRSWTHEPLGQSQAS